MSDETLHRDTKAIPARQLTAPRGASPLGQRPSEFHLGSCWAVYINEFSRARIAPQSRIGRLVDSWHALLQFEFVGEDDYWFVWTAKKAYQKSPKARISDHQNPKWSLVREPETECRSRMWPIFRRIVAIPQSCYSIAFEYFDIGRLRPASVIA
jgi:hypothetical protein